MKKLPTFPKWNENHQPTDAELKELISARAGWAEARVIEWDKRGLQPEDYDFRSWASEKDHDAKHGHFSLRLGVCYEYARESIKLRSLILLADPERKRARWESNCPLEFADVTENAARNALGEMFDSLARLAKPLAENLSFEEVRRKQPELLKKVIEAGKYQRGVWSKLLSAPVTLARHGELETATVLQTVSRKFMDGKEVIALRVDWANYRDEHLKENFGILIKTLRRTKNRGRKVPPEPKPQKTGKNASVLKKALTCLKAARVLDFCHGKPLETAWEILGLNAGRNNKGEANYYRYAAEFRRDFKTQFPFAGQPCHSKTPKRQRR
jgi:hypothetical protein